MKSFARPRGKLSIPLRFSWLCLYMWQVELPRCACVCVSFSQPPSVLHPFPTPEVYLSKHSPYSHTHTHIHLPILGPEWTLSSFLRPRKTAKRSSSQTDVTRHVITDHLFFISWKQRLHFISLWEIKKQKQKKNQQSKTLIMKNEFHDFLLYWNLFILLRINRYY